MASECPCKFAAGMERGLARAVVIARPDRLVEKEVALGCQFESDAAQVLEIVADAESEIGIAIVDARPGGDRKPAGYRWVDIGSVAVRESVFIRSCGLDDVLADVFSGGSPCTIEHSHRFVFEVEIVADVGVAALVMDISQSVACVRMLGRNMKVERRIERITRTGFEIAELRSVEVPERDGRRMDGLQFERGVECERRYGVGDFGTHLRRVGHVGCDGQLGSLLHARDVFFRHFDLFPDLGSGRAGQYRAQGGYQQDFFHFRFSLRMRAAASSTMPSSSGE